ncbi:MAG TPA: tetratricopeptide repeat protein [Candidatus Acidoferrum sp.]|nr:tetratricopeptide repeat protein [Candidatus Acidoferrum sp.]
MTRRFPHLALCAALAAPASLCAQANAKPAVKSSSATQGTRRVVNNPLNDLLDQARAAIERNDFQAAVEPLQKFLAEKDDFAYAHFQLAYVYTALKQPKEARAEYEKATALDPKMSEAQLNLGILLLESDPAAAVTPLSKAVELLPTQTRPRFLLGAAQERSGDFKAAAQSFEAALALDPKDLDTTLHLAHLYYNQKRYSEAESKFRAALDLQPNLPAALLGLAQSLDAQKKPEAAEAYQNYLKTQPDDPAAKENLARSLVAKDQFDAAEALLGPEQPGVAPTLDSLKLRADIQIGQKKWDAAATTLKQAVALAPKDAKLHGGLGRVYLQLRDFKNAELELKNAVRLDQNNVAYWKDLSSTFYLAGNYPGTLAVLDAIAKVEKPTPGTWFIRALCYDKLQQTQPALDAYQKFLELDQDKNPDQVWQAQQRSIVLKKVLQKK